jgi:hypothetical protein
LKGIIEEEGYKNGTIENEGEGIMEGEGYGTIETRNLRRDNGRRGIQEWDNGDEGS